MSQFLLVGGVMGYYIASASAGGLDSNMVEALSGSDLSSKTQIEHLLDQHYNQTGSGIATGTDTQTPVTPIPYDFYVQFHEDEHLLLQEYDGQDTAINNYFSIQSDHTQTQTGHALKKIQAASKLIQTISEHHNVKSIEATFKNLVKRKPGNESLTNTYKMTVDVSDYDQFIRQRRQSSLIKYIEPAPAITIGSLPDDPQLKTQQRYLDHINAYQARTATDNKNKKTIVVGVIDNAIDTTHPELKNRIIAQKDLTNGENDARPPNNEGVRDHGTHVAGIIAAATNNKQGIASIAGDNVKILAAKTAVDESDGKNIKAFIQGIERSISNGANIVNMSLGGPLHKKYGKTYEQIIQNNPDVLFIAAAGNEGINPDLKGIEASALGYLPKGSYGIYPAAVETNNMMAVAATDKQDKKASFSNYGNYIDIAAPGIDIYSTTPDDSYKKHKGTSMAAPIITSLAALIRSADPSLTAAQVKQKLQDSITQIQAKNIGAGVVNACLAVNSIEGVTCKVPAKKHCNNDKICQPNEGETAATCPSDCTLNNQASTTTPTPTQTPITKPKQTQTNQCGDKKVSTGEQCDDGNTMNNDGCSAQCKREKPTCDIITTTDKQGNFYQATITSIGNNSSWINISKAIRDNVQSNNTILPITQIFSKSGKHDLHITLHNKRHPTTQTTCVKQIDTTHLATQTPTQSPTSPSTTPKQDTPKQDTPKQDTPKQDTPNNKDTENTTQQQTFGCASLIAKATITDPRTPDKVTFSRKSPTVVTDVALQPSTALGIEQNVSSPLIYQYPEAGTHTALLIAKTQTNQIHTCPITVNIPKGGCTDPHANNYDATATANNGTCQYSNSATSTTNNNNAYLKILTTIPYRPNSGLIQGHIIYSHTPADVQITITIAYQGKTITRLTPTLNKNGTFTIPINTTQPTQTNYISPGDYTITFDVTHAQGTSAQKIYTAQIP